MGVVSNKLRRSASGQACTFRLHGCETLANGATGTVVLCHIRDNNAGMGTKANDFSSAFGCFSCHQIIDQHRLPRDQEAAACLRAMQRTHAIWFELGLLRIAGDDKPPKRPPPSSKIMKRPEFFRR